MATDRLGQDRARTRRALAPLIPLVDGYWERAELLKARGWYSFEPYWTFRKCLCSPDEWQTYKKYVIEEIKEALGDYCSDFLNELSGSTRGWELLRAVACARNYEDLRQTGGDYIAWAPFRREQMRRRQREIELHATRVSRDRPEGDEKIKRIRIWGEVVREMCEPLGFETRSRMSGRHSPIFRRTLTPQWSFALGVDARSLGSETADTIAKPPSMAPLPIGSHLTWKALVPVGKSTVHPGGPESIFVPQYFFPLDRAYSNFWDMEGLEINVRADMTALQILWPDLAPRLIEGVSGLQ